MNFASFASPEWVKALQICNIDLGYGIKEGNEIVFKNIFTGSQKYHSLRYLIRKQVFMNHCASGSEMHLTPVKLISKLTQISEKQAWILLQKELGKWKDFPSPTLISLNKYKKENVPTNSKNYSEFRSFSECMQNEWYQKRCELLTLIAKELEFTKNKNASRQVLEWWEKRGFNLECAFYGKKSFVLLNSPEQLEKLNCVQNLTLEEKYLTGIWKPHAITNKPCLQWISKDYLALFFCWNYLYDSNGNAIEYVTGIRARYTNLQPTNQPKEVTLGIKHIPELERFPASIGYYGLLIPKALDHKNTSWLQYNGCENFTVILTEGCTDMLAGRHLLKRSDVIWATSGQIQSAMWKDNLRLIRNCKRLIIAFNNDNKSKLNTGQEIAFKTKEAAEQFGIKNVELFPIELLESCNDLNDLLKKKKASNSNLEAFKNYF